MLNKIVIMGRLTKDPELRRTQSGVSVCSCTVAVEREFKGADGNRETDFINVVAWRNTAEFLAKYFGKGQLVCVTGALQMRSYEDRDGNKRTAAEVIADGVYFTGERKTERTGGNEYGTGDFMEVENDGPLPF